jgi:hypothetical protein
LDKFPTKNSFDQIKETCIQIMRESMDGHSEVWFESKYSNMVNEIYEESSDILGDSISIELHNQMKILYEKALLEARDEIVNLQRKISNNEQSIQLSATPRGRGSGAGRGSGGGAPTGGRGAGRGSGGGAPTGGRGKGRDSVGRGRGSATGGGAPTGGRGKGRGSTGSERGSTAGRGSGAGGKGGGKDSAAGRDKGSGKGNGEGGSVNGVDTSKSLPPPLPPAPEPLPCGVVDSCMDINMKNMGISMDEDQLEEFKETICGIVNDVHNGDSEYDNMRRTLNDAHVMRELRRRHGKETESMASPLQRDATVDTIENEDEKIAEKGRDEDNMTALPQHPTDGRLTDSGLIGDITETLQPHIDEKFTLDCPICLETLCTDVTSKDYTGCCIGKTCGHALCSSCWKKNRKSKICPVCRRLLFLGPGRRPDAHVY